MKITPMSAFLGKQETKDFYIARVRAHREADQLVKGFYWERGKGCAVGCTVHSGNHAAYETELGIPRILAKLEDGIFEALSNGEAMAWPEKFLSAIPVGADLSLVWPRFAVWMLVDPTWGVLQFAKSERSKKSIQDVADGYYKALVGKPEPDWRTLRAAAAAAAYAAAAAAYAADAAYAAAYAAAAAAYAADAAAAYAADAARSKWRSAQAGELLELLSIAGE
jgi:hypothetical protein